MSVPQHSHLAPQASDFDHVPVSVPQAMPNLATTRREQALRLWLRWNEAYERLTGEMFEVAHDQSQVEALAEEVDRLRQRAVAAARNALR